MAANKKVNVVIRAKDQGATKAVTGFGKALLSVKSLIAGGIGFFTLKKGLDATVGSAARAQSQLKKLAVAMKSAGRFTTENVEAFRQLSIDLERTTGFLEEDVLKALSILQTFGRMTRDDMEKTITAALNMATVFDEDVSQAAIRLGKAYVGQLDGLQRVGVSFSKAQFNAEGFAGVLRQLALEQGGQAEARLKGFEGAAKGVGVEFDNLTKEVGRFVTLNDDLVESLRVASGALKIITTFIVSKRNAEAESLDTIEEYIDLTDKQRSALLNLANSNVVVSFQKDLNGLVKEELDLRKDLESLLTGGGIGLFGNVMQEQIGLENDIQKNLNDQANIRKRIKDLMQDPNIAKELSKQADATGNIVKETKSLNDELTEADKKTIAAGERAANIWTAVAEKTRERIDLAIEAAEVEKQAIIDVANTAFENMRRRAEVIKETNQDILNDAVDIANKELAARERLSQKLSDIENKRLRDSLNDETLNATERKILLEEAAEDARRLNEELGTATTATELENVISKLEALDNTLKGAEGAADVRDTLREGFEQAEALVAILGRAKLSPDFDVEDMKRKIGTAAEASADEFIKRFKRRLQTADLTVPVKVVPTGTMIGEGG